MAEPEHHHHHHHTHGGASDGEPKEHKHHHRSKHPTQELGHKVACAKHTLFRMLSGHVDHKVRRTYPRVVFVIHAFSTSFAHFTYAR